MIPETIAILDFGGQYTQLIARRVRECHVHGVIVPPTVTPRDFAALNLKGMIWSGGPSSVHAGTGPNCAPQLLELNVPVLGICYGMQLLCAMSGGKVRATKSREYGRTALSLLGLDALWAHVPEQTDVWMSHADQVEAVSPEFETLASTPSCPLAAVRHRTQPWYGVQFHPEVTHSPYGRQIIRNFLYEICRCRGDWSVGQVTQDIIEAIRRQVGDRGRVLCALSGGVDSTVAAALIHLAVGRRLTCIFVDNGLLREDEAGLVESTFRRHFQMELHVIDAAERFLSRLCGVTDPQEKRRIIGHEFISIFQDEATRFDDARFLAQGTLYPDVIESGFGAAGKAAGIKLHHNVGGLPQDLEFELVEPLRDLFKDEVRRVGEHLGLPEEIVWRHPFPGPGLAVRIVGDVRKERLAILRAADRILLEELRAAGWHHKVAQAFGVLVPVSTVGVMGDGRTYEGHYVVAVRVVETEDFMTADWVRLDHEVLSRISSRISNEVKGVNRVVYDISSKPPATIEWE